MKDQLETTLKQKICDEIRVAAKGLNRYLIHQPFAFDDGDHFVVVVKKDGDRWAITDEGHTLMHMDYYDLDLRKGTRAAILERVLETYSVENREGELRISVQEDEIGDAVFSYLQAINKITDLDYLKREYVKSTFLEDARQFFEEIIPENRRTFNYHDESRDPGGTYPVDCYINGSACPNLVFFIPNDDKCRESTIVCHQFERWNVPFRATGIFENIEEINRRAQAQFTDIARKQFSSLGVKDRIQAYFEEVLQGRDYS